MTTISLSISKSSTLTSAILALVLGAGLVFAAGFAHAQMLHDAAHDVRHSTGFPCH